MKDWFLAAAAALGAVGYLYSDFQIPRTQLGDPLGPRAFPALIGILLLISAALLALENLRREPVRAEPRGAFRRTPYPVLTCMLVWTIGYYAVLEPAGYIIATIVYLFGLLCYFNARRHLANAAVAVGFTVVAYTVFSRLLSVQLPPGPMGF